MPNDIEVDPREALREDSGPDRLPQDLDQAENPVVAPPAEEKAPDVIDVLKPRAEQRVWIIRDTPRVGDPIVKEYVQKPLSYFGKMEFFGLVGEVIDKAMAGEDGLKVSSLLEGPGVNPETGLRASDLQNADTFVQAIAKLLAYAPDFLQKCYTIWWNVPQFERPWVIEVISRDPENGGLTDDEGIEAIEIFIDQNMDALEGFFRDKVSSLRDRVQARREESGRSQPSSRSNATQPPTENE